MSERERFTFDIAKAREAAKRSNCSGAEGIAGDAGKCSGCSSVADATHACSNALNPLKPLLGAFHVAGMRSVCYTATLLQKLPAGRVNLFAADARQFLEIWGERACELGWTGEELLGLDPVAPLARYDRMGLIWFLKGREHVTELTANAARLSGGNSFYRRAAP
jgi:hypothetical protein